MSVIKGKKTGRWMSQVRVKDWTGKEIHKKKRGFSTKKEALQWERDFISQAEGSLGMKFKDLSRNLYERCGSSNQRNYLCQQALSVR